MDTLPRRASARHIPRQLDFLDRLFATVPGGTAVPTIPTEPSLADRLHTRPESWPFLGAEPLVVRRASELTLRAALTASVFDAYRLRLCVRGAQDHPTPLVESAAMAAMRELASDGVFAEIHAFRTRFFVPVGERAAAVLSAVTRHRPVVEITEPRRIAA